MKRTLSLILSFAFFVGTFSGVISAEAKSTSQLRSEKQKIQQQIDSAQSKLNKLSAEKKKNQEYLEALRSKINLLQDKIDSLEEDKSALQAEIDAIGVKIAKTEQNIAEAQAKIDQKQAEFDQTYQIYCQRLRAMYISGSASTLEVLLTCKDVSSMLTRAQMVKSVSQQDNAILDDLMKKMEEIEKEKKKLEEKRTELTNDKKQLESNKSKSELDSEVAECNSIMKELSSQSSEYMELIETNQAQLEQVESEIRAAIASASRGSGSISGSTGGGSGQLGYPTDSRSISAGYPNYSSGGYHGGIDFPVRTGSNVYAAASGTVILVKYLNYSYGRYIIIDHGDGLSTLYAHNSSISVSVGDKVSRGQVIAHSGSTGNSTGPHCHFEVRVNGSRVNPNNYL